MRLLRFALCTLLALLPSAARAAEDGVYPKAPPPDSAFVRPVNGAEKTIGPYAPHPPGPATLFDATAALKPGARYVAALGPAGASVLEEPAFDPLLKGQIVLLNLSSRGDAVLTSGETELLPATPPGTLSARAVNPVSATLCVFRDKKEVGCLPATLTPRGTSRLVLVTDRGVTDGGPARIEP